MEERHYIAFDIKNYDSELNLMVEVGNVLAAGEGLELLVGLAPALSRV